VQATPTTGVIRGIVVDQAVHPIVGANVTLTNPPQTVTTNDAGAFGFEDLEPGTYFFKVDHKGYSQIQASAEVVAGEGSPAPVRIQMVAVQQETPFVESLHAILFLTWSGWVTGVGGVTVGNLLGDGNYNFRLDITPNGTVAQTELVWEPTTPLGAEALSSGGTYHGNDAVETGVWTGPSPLVMVTNATGANATANSVYFDFYAWPSSPLPVGMHVNQQADAFINIFHNFRPNPGWTFTRDGEYPPPS
jgi:hypothetical protein